MRLTSSTLLLIAGLCACGSDGDRPPDIVLITIDTLRADRLGAYGYFRDTSPALDALAKESLVFERCYAPMATTFPSHLSLLTSTYPYETGAVANRGAGGAKFIPTPYLRSLAQILGEAGYRTAAFVSAAPLKKFSGISAGFDTFDQPNDEMRSAADTNARALEWFDRRDDAPSFLWIHYFDPHSPYEPPEPFDSTFRPDEEQDRYLRERDFQPAYVNDRLPIYVNNKYDGEIRYMDQQIGELLDELNLNDTILVLVGDHGEGLGQHDEKEHGGLWNEQLHVPLLMKVPGVSAGRSDRLMSVADIVPTLMGLVELPGEDAFLRQASGVDRLAEDTGRTIVFSQESAAPWRTNQGARRPGYAVTGADWKLIHLPDGDDLLFHLAEDPFELHDVSGEHPEIAERLRKRALERVELHKRRGALLGTASQTTEEDLDPEILEQLRSLGYVQ